MMKRTLILFLIMFVSGCGFKLRGMMDMPAWLNNIAIIIQEAHQDLGPALKEQFQAYDKHILSDPAQADYWLLIEKDSTQQQITNISASTTPRQYQLIYIVQYSLKKKNGETLVSSNIVTVNRQLTVNNDRILGSDSEGTLINAEMRREAVRQIINRLSRK